MSEPSANGAPARSEEERAAAFAELMRLENAQNKPPISGLAVAAVIFGLMGGIFGLVCGIGAIVQIRAGERRGMGLAVAGVVAFVGWVVGITVAVMT